MRTRKRPRRQRKQELLPDEWRQIDLVAVVKRKFQVLDAEPVAEQPDQLMPPTGTANGGQNDAAAGPLGSSLVTTGSPNALVLLS